jgi:hypothetical protein
MTLTEIRDLAAEHGIECEPVDDSPHYCRLVMPSRSTPEWCQLRVREDEPIRMLPPLLFSTAKQILEGRSIRPEISGVHGRWPERPDQRRGRARR